MSKQATVESESFVSERGSDNLEGSWKRGWKEVKYMGYSTVYQKNKPLISSAVSSRNKMVSFEVTTFPFQADIFPTGLQRPTAQMSDTVV